MSRRDVVAALDDVMNARKQKIVVVVEKSRFAGIR